MPLPPVIGPLKVAAGPGGAGARVDGVDCVDRGAVVDDEGFVDFDDDEQAAATMTAAAAAARMTHELRRIRGSLARAIRTVRPTYGGPMEPEQMRRRVRDARVARLATVTSDGRPHVLPCCFALSGDTREVVYSAVDAK
ncbi:MAG: family class F420-dependent oxidoreductase, partial [Actinomycetia bacterium]|nr:family class F420-dependent oxidoreductase [Actinomycetes bacterium]